VPGGEEELFQWLRALGMNPPRPVVAGGPVGTTSLGWLAAVLQVLQNPFLQQRKKGCSEAGRVEELFHWLDALGMNPPQPVLASGAVGTALLGCLASLFPLLKHLFLEPSAEEDKRVAGSMEGAAQGTHKLCEGQARPVVAVGGASVACRGYLAADIPLRMCLLLEPPRGKTGEQLGGGKALTEAQPSFKRVDDGLSGLSGGSAAVVVRRIPCNIIEHSSNQVHRTVATQSRFWSCSLCVLVLRSMQWVSLTMVSDCYLDAPAARHLYLSNFDWWLPFATNAPTQANTPPGAPR
jgi:hypothetical protein